MGKAPWIRGAQAAAALRHRMTLGFAPINPWQLAEQAGAAVARRDFGDEGGDGLYVWDGDRGLIVVNSSLRSSRARFTVAHELGHHEMHRYDTDHLVIADWDVSNDDEDQEKEANAFAANLLAPDEALAEHLGDRAGPDITADDVVELMGSLGLSYQALVYRLFNANLISASHRNNLHAAGDVERRVEAAGFDEDQIFPAGPELPARLTDRSLSLYRDHVISGERLAELLGMGVSEAEAFAEQRGMPQSDELDPDEEALAELVGS